MKYYSILVGAERNKKKIALLANRNVKTRVYRTAGGDWCGGRARRDVAGTGQDTEVLWSPWLSGFPVLYSRGDYLTVYNARARDSDALLLPAINTRRMCVPAAAASPPANFAAREYYISSWSSASYHRKNENNNNNNNNDNKLQCWPRLSE